jgi:hypothetical protein
LTAEQIAAKHLEFARVNRHWLGSGQQVIVVKAQPEPQHYASHEELELVVNDAEGDPTVAACAFFTASGIECRTGLVEGTWISHAIGAAHAALVRFYAPTERFGLGEGGRLTIEAHCATDGVSNSRALRCEGKYIAIPTSASATGASLTCVLSSCEAIPAEETHASGAVPCADLEQARRMLVAPFANTVWRNVYWMRVADGFTNHYLTGY